MEFQTLGLEGHNSIAIVRFNRPRVLDALNQSVFRELILAFDEIEKEAIPKVLILTGTGDRAFVGGTDIAEMEKLTSFEARRLSILSHMAFDKIENLNKTVIAAINGFALEG